MKITKVRVGYSELRTDRLSYSNKKFSVEFEAETEENENPDAIKKQLLEKAIMDVKKLHGEKIDGIKILILKEEDDF